jgi:hypothetical protein
MTANAPKEGEMKLDPKYDDYDFPLVAPVKANGHPGHLTEQQQAQVAQLRMMLEAEGFTKRLDTLTLVRSLFSSSGGISGVETGRANGISHGSYDSYEHGNSTSIFPRTCMSICRPSILAKAGAQTYMYTGSSTARNGGKTQT